MKTTRVPRAILIDVIPPSMDVIAAERRLTELTSLLNTFGGILVVKMIQRRQTPDYKTYVGTGKVDELIELAKAEKAELLVVNNLLKPGQVYNLQERFRKAKSTAAVWDRVDLILKIFDKHATTAEAKLQIKLAALKHMGPRIYGMGFEMMQQKGGTSTRGGQGETNTELMKRHVFKEEQHARKELEKIAISRAGHRARRERLGLKTVSVIGYTNAGKSSLTNALTQKGAYVANALFATLDTRVGKIWYPSEDGAGKGKELLVSDTIGFIQDLPPELIDAFRSTLDETVDADLLLHVIDVADEHVHEKIAEVEAILEQLKVHEIPKIYVFNKIDLLKKIPKIALKKQYKEYTPLFVSSKTGEGLDALKTLLQKKLLAD
ncbi:MAG: GTPase HflX [Candidatus Magasanikbacteria bacterium]|nr:GTPase HflX [Candidatus Magasanikbacteria bacterium]MCA9390731.1 GTPase HflX [Candidatus Magasanikbacteria bacterium]USN52283.1 MAG: GTPase HflX [Candidatus Nomurabacteria bacterium]HPF95175.1 GTPase HflX [bacterium]